VVNNTAGEEHRQLTTLTGWRRFAGETIAVPELLAGEVWTGLEDDKRLAYDQDRLEYHSRLLVIETPLIRKVITEGRRLSYLNRSAVSGRCGLILSGPAGTGKTTAVTQLGKMTEVMHRKRRPGSGSDIPVVYITAPPAATAKMIAVEFARFLGLPVARRLNITDITEAVCGVCLDARTSLVRVDEIHNLNLATRNGAEVSDTLKYFSERPGHVRLRRDQRRAGRPAIRHPRRADRRAVRNGPDRAVPPRCPLERPDRRPRIQPAPAPARPRHAPRPGPLPAPAERRLDRQPAAADTQRCHPGHP
jgi:AAA domain